MGTPAFLNSSGTFVRIQQSRALFAIGQRKAAIQIVDRLVEGQPQEPAVLSAKANLLARLGDVAGAKDTLQTVVKISPDFPRALHSLAELSFPGPHYGEVLASLHAALAPETYLEIGVRFGGTLALASQSQTVVGVDPAFRVGRRLGKSAKLFREKSDDFFATRSRQSVLGDRFVDLAFIDGMHLFEFVLRDFANVERWCHSGSTIVLHDCLPPAPIAAARERETAYWVGDCWKALEFLLEFRPQLQVMVVPCYPSGLVIVRGLDPSSTIIDDTLPQMEAEYINRPFPYQLGCWPAHYPVIENTRASLQQKLQSSEGRELGQRPKTAIDDCSAADGQTATPNDPPAPRDP